MDDFSKVLFAFEPATLVITVKDIKELVLKLVLTINYRAMASCLESEAATVPPQIPH